MKAKSSSLGLCTFNKYPYIPNPIYGTRVLHSCILQLKAAVPVLLMTVTFGLLVAYILLGQPSGTLPAQKGAYRNLFMICQIDLNVTMGP